MARRPKFLHALAAAATGLALLGSAPAGAAATLDPAPPAPAPAAPAATADGSRANPGTATARRKAAAKRRKAQDEYDAPLDITIDDLTPGELPRRGPLVVRGTVTNVGLETWEDITLYPMFGAGPNCDVCPGPMTTSLELEEAAEAEPEAPVGERYTGVRYDIAALGPGESTSYSLRIPQDVLREQFPAPGTGVYWFGVHAIGGSATSPRDEFADGRARTFLPSVRVGSDQVVDTAVVVPLRGRITHAADGRLGRISGWERALSLQGRVGGPLAFGAAAPSGSVTWLVDPAVPDAVRRLAAGNPPRQIEPVPQEPAEPGASDDPSDGQDPDDNDAGDEPSDDAAGGGDDADDRLLDADEPVVRTAADWLRQAEAALKDDAVATLPYGDLDVAAAATSLPGLYRTARDHEGHALTSWGVEGTPVVAPPNGYLDEPGIHSVDDGAVVVLGDQMFPSEAFGDAVPATGVVEDRPVVVRSTGAAEGGPGPDPRLAPVALRQRLLSEAAVRLAQSGGENPAPLVAVMPAGLQAAGATSFWEGLDLGWLRLVDLDTVVDRADGITGSDGPGSEPIDPAQLAYPPDQDLLEVESEVLAELDGVVHAARSLQSILGEDHRIAGQLLDEALTGASYALRTDPLAERRLARTRGWIHDQLGKVSIDAPHGVTLSSTSGGFNVSVRNQLDYPVTVRIEASTDSGARIGVANPVELAANSRSSVPITADMSRPGVHNVRLRLTDLDGRSIGDSDELPIRSGQVGAVIWAIIGTGLGILFMAIAIRLYRRIRAHRRGSPDGRSASSSTSEEIA